MTPVAASGDTWGISGPQFLALYAILAVVAVVIAVLWRRRLTRGSGTGYLSTGRASATEVAYLNGGYPRAVQASLAGLRWSGTLELDGSGRMVTAGPAPSGVDGLGYAVHNSLRTPRTWRELIADPEVRAAGDAVRDSAVRQGWLLSAQERHRVRLAVLPVLGVLVLAVLRAIAGNANGKPIGYLIGVMLATGVLTLPVLLAVPTVTRAGRGLLGQLRERYSYLTPRHSPS
ncbi:MAG TPA: TIGR04222 domain-containing membrane protein, partial [Rugosimonospora sp.]|nr:TIGR04222 domain-containing membrane protein [Rugosimonospora sp.]